MEIAELSLQSIAAAIDDHIQERCKLAEELKDVEAKSAAAEKALREAEKIVADARSEAVSLVEKKQLLLNKISTTNAMNDRLQKSFLKNQDKEKELESQLAKTESDISNERDKLNGEFLKLQNPTFFDLRIRDTTDFELPEINIEALMEKQLHQQEV